MHRLTLQSLTKSYDGRKVVDAVSMEVRSGEVVGLLGPNGAGKTTTISLLLGLLKPSEGTCEVLGFPPGNPKGLAQVGALVESPGLYDHLTGRENIEITRLMRAVPRSEGDRVLSLVGLQQDARKPVRNYSLGMRQRLGIALALMGQPQLLILDEPTNGLDPSGIQEIRELIRSLPKETGATIFLSSHLLAEVEQVAEDVVVIHHGQLRYQGPLSGLGSAGPSQILLKVGEPAKAVQLLGAKGFNVREDTDRVWVQAEEEAAPQIASCLVQGGVDLYELSTHRANLEARFLALLEGE